MMLGDSTVVEQLAKENRSLVEKIRDWLREWVENLKIALEGLQADRTESRAMLQYARELQEIWDNALMDAARNNRGTVEETAPAESRQSIRKTSNGKKYVKADRQVLFGSDPDSWSEQLEDYINGKIRRGQDVQLIAEDGDVLLLTRTSAGKLSDNHTSDGRTMSDAAFERKANAAAHIDELVEVSFKGKKTIIDKDARHGDMASGGWNYRTAYFMDFDGKYYKTTISVAEGSGGSIVYNVGKMQERSTPQIGGSSGKAGALRGNASTNSIRQSNDNSQEKSSDKVQSSMRDSAGRELTEAQQAYFKDSKVRDADGKLKLVYHGSAAIFTKFSADFMSQNGSSEGQGFYFTDYKPMAQGYEKNGGQLLEGYLDIKKPLSDSEVTLTAAEVKRLIRAVDPTGDDLVLNYDSRGGMGYPSRAWYNRSVEDTLRATMSTSDSDSEILAELANGMGDPGKVLKTVRELLGYDGYIVEGKYDNATVYVAFDSSQFKNADNKNPTADPDIRYQQRDNLKEEYHLTDDEESAIISYKSGDSYTLNGKLTARAELTEYQRKLRDNLDTALEKLPVYRGEVYRHYNFDDFGGFEAMADFLNLFRKGMVANQRGYLSCSTVSNEDRTGGKYTVNMVIQSENGRRLTGFGRNTENEILLPRNTRLVPYQMERVGPTSIRIYAREEVNYETREADDTILSGVREVREGTRRSEDLRQVSGRNPEEVQREMGRHAGRDGDRGGMPGLREGEGSASLDATGVEENHRGYETRGGEGEGVKNQQREPRLSDRDVLRMAADMAQRDRSQRWSVDDLNRFDLLQRKLLQLDEANAELEALKEERKVLLAGRKVKELTRDEQFELSQNRNRTETQKDKMFVNHIQRVARNNIS